MPATTPADDLDDGQPVRFLGRGSGLLRLWAIHLVLRVVTLGLYAPWARQRTLQWYRQHTVVAGAALDDAGSPRWRPWDPMGLVAACLWLGSAQVARCFDTVVEEASVAVPLACAAAVGAGAAWICWVAAVRVRLASVRWRGLQPRFRATGTDLAQAGWPAVALGAAWAAGGAWGAMLTYQLVAIGPDAHDSIGRAAAFNVMYGALLLMGLVPVSAVLALTLRYGADRLAFGQSRVGGEPVRFGPAGRTYVFAAIGAGLVLAAGLIAVRLAAGMLMPPVPDLSMVGPLHPGRQQEAIDAYDRLQAVYWSARWLQVLGWAGAAAIALAWFEARLFAVVCNGTTLGTAIRCRCVLSPFGFVRLRALNVLLTVATLGLYLPFARVREYRAKAESVTVLVADGIDALADSESAIAGAAASPV